ncbi:unnamed protein product [Notodromas monacha]|uniref:Uncharacterized protein n=1 Tax=Notodromas monacha TaxID=399045 RepID=A0A7R9BNV2_9CRUS|nr:unnamed protein product [Notodromas monacha]CAG0918101.1 unnamed protein product [Notodromas monacha]
MDLLQWSNGVKRHAMDNVNCTDCGMCVTLSWVVVDFVSRKSSKKARRYVEVVQPSASAVADTSKDLDESDASESEFEKEEDCLVELVRSVGGNVDGINNWRGDDEIDEESSDDETIEDDDSGEINQVNVDAGENVLNSDKEEHLEEERASEIDEDDDAENVDQVHSENGGEVANISEPDDDEEIMNELEEDAEGDPFLLRFEHDISDTVVETLQDSSKCTQSELRVPSLGRVLFKKCVLEDSEAERCPTKSMGTEDDLEKILIHTRRNLRNHLSETNLNIVKDSQQLTAIQKRIYSLISSYADFLMTDRNINNTEEVRVSYCLHVLNHVLKTRSRVMKHNRRIQAKREALRRERLAQASEGKVEKKKFPVSGSDDVEYRDQGFFRPKVLILVPFRDSALRVCNTLMNLLLGDISKKAANVVNRKKLEERYGWDAEQVERLAELKPADYTATFSGNPDDAFLFGVALTKKTLKFFANMYSSDILIASPMGLRVKIGGEGEKDRDMDFLASIEILIMDQTDVFLMQNWSHVLHILDHMHLTPSQNRDIDFSRVRMWSLSGHAALYRQTMIFSSVPTVEISSVFNKKCKNMTGKYSTANSVDVGSISSVIIPIPQTFRYFTASSPLEDSKERFQIFVEKVLPRFRDAVTKRVLIYIPSYFDFLTVRNYFRKSDLEFAEICEYTEEKKIKSARNKFFRGFQKFLLFTERFHFFRRYKMKGMQHIIFFGLPTYPHFYSEMINFMQGRMSGDGVKGEMSCTVIVSQVDALKLSGVVGTAKAASMLRDKKESYFLGSCSRRLRVVPVIASLARRTTITEMLLRQQCLESLRRSPRLMLFQLKALRKNRKATHEIISTLLSLSVDFQRGERPQVKFPEVIRFLFHWLPEIESVPIRISVVRSVVELARNGLHSVMRLCASGLIMDLIALLSRPEAIYNPDSAEHDAFRKHMGVDLDSPIPCGSSAEVLGGIFTLLKILGSHSISDRELRAIFLRLLRGKRDVTPYPYISQVLFSLVEMAKREGFKDSQYFFDIQHSRDVMRVVGIKRWPGSGNSYTFHCWVRLVSENSSEDTARLKRRYLYSFHVGSGATLSGFEAFFGPKGVLTVSVWDSKDMHSASVHEFPLGDGRWHCVTISHSANWRSIRPFAQSQLSVFFDGALRLVCPLRCPVLNQPLTEVVIGGAGHRNRSYVSEETSAMSSWNRKSQVNGQNDVKKPDVPEKSKGFFGSLVSAVPSILPQLPSAARTKSANDPNIRVSGIPHLLRYKPLGHGEAPDQIAPTCSQADIWRRWQAYTVIQELILEAVVVPLTLLYVENFRTKLRPRADTGGSSSSFDPAGILSSSASPMSSSSEGELEMKLVFWYDARVTSSGEKLCVDLSPNRTHSAHCSAPVSILMNIRDALNKIGGLHVLFPLLEKLPHELDVDLSLVSPTSGSALPPVVMTTYSGHLEDTASSLGEWEMLSSRDDAEYGKDSSNRGFVRNQAAGLFSLIRILSAESLVCLDQLLRYRAIPVLGYLLQKLPPALVDINLLISLELFCEQLRDQRRDALLEQMYAFILFDFRIWTNCSFIVRIGHFQALCRIIHENKVYFRRNFGVQFLLDVIHQHYKLVDRLSPEDTKAVRAALINLIKYFISRDPTAAEVSAILRFTFSVHEEEVVMDILQMLYAYLESKAAKDQIYLLLYENGNAELFYGLLIQKHFSTEFKELVCRIMMALLGTDKVQEKNKTRLRLGDVGYGGFFSFLKGQMLSEGVAAQLVNQMLMIDSQGSLCGVLLLTAHLQHADRIETKLTVGRILQAYLHHRMQATSRSFARQSGWQYSVCCLFTKCERRDLGVSKSGQEDKEISVASPSAFLNSLSLDVENDPDLMSFELIDSATGRGRVDMAAAAWQMLPQQLTEIRGMAETVGSVAVTSVISDNLETVTSAVVPDKIQSAASNMSKSVASKISNIKRRTLQVQESVEEVGESVVAIGEAAFSSLRKSRESPASSSPSSPYLPSKMLLARTKDSSKDDGSILSLQQEVDAYVDFGVHLIASIMWEGIPTEGAAFDEVWKDRGAVFCCLKELALTNVLFAPLLEVERRILERLIELCLETLKDQTQITPELRETGHMMLKWAYHLMTREDKSLFSFRGDAKQCLIYGCALSERLLDKVICLLDVLGIFGDSPEEENRDLTAAVLVKNTEHYSFLIPVMKALLDKVGSLGALHLPAWLPSLPTGTNTPSFDEEFQHYCMSGEWREFVQTKI